MASPSFCSSLVGLAAGRRSSLNSTISPKLTPSQQSIRAALGRATVPRPATTIRDFADDLADFCNRVGIVKPVVIGHSLGGGIAVELGARYPSLPRALVLVDPVSIDMTPETIKSFDAAADQLEGPCGEDVRRLWTESMGAREPELAGWISDHMCATPLQVAAAVIRNLTSWNGVGALSNCEVPTLLVGRSEMTAEVARLLAIKPDLQVGMTVGSGHFNQLEVPEQVNAMIERFLNVTV